MAVLLATLGSLGVAGAASAAPSLTPNPPVPLPKEAPAPPTPAPATPAPTPPRTATGALPQTGIDVPLEVLTGGVLLALGAGLRLGRPPRGSQQG